MVAYCANEDCGMEQDDHDELVKCPKCGSTLLVVGLRVIDVEPDLALTLNDKRLLRGMRIKP